MGLWHKYDRDWRRVTFDSTATPGPDGCVLRRFRLPVPDRRLAGQRLLFWSDLHYQRRNVVRLDELPALINREQADWIVFGGDLVRYLVNVPKAIGLMTGLAAGRGKLAVLGNRERHHSWLPQSAWASFYAEAGTRLLVNEAWTPPDAAAPVFVGLDDCRYGEPRLGAVAEFADSGRFVVLITHSPDTVGETTGSFVGHLVLAGHTHAGQMRLPLVGPVYTSSAYGRQFAGGWFRRRSDEALMFVTAGFGITGRSIFRRRLLCPPEIVVIEFV